MKTKLDAILEKRADRSKENGCSHSPETILSFAGGSAVADLIRFDGRRWRNVVAVAFAAISDPTTCPSIVKRHFDELLRLADVADEILEELKAS